MCDQQSGEDAFLFFLQDEIVLHFFMYLDVCDLLSAGRTCKAFMRIAEDAYLWRSFKPEVFKMLRTSRSITNVKGEYLQMTKMAKKMWDGKCSVVTFQAGVDPVVGVSREGNILAACTCEYIQVWDINKMMSFQLRDAVGDDDEIFMNTSKRLILVKRSKLVVASKDFTINVYNIRSKSRRLLGTLHGHTDKVVCVNWEHADLLYTGSRDGTVCLWDTRTMTCARVFAFAGKVFSVGVVVSDPYRLIVGHEGGNVSYLDIRQPDSPTNTFCVCEEGSGRVTGMRVYENFIYYTEDHRYIYKYDVKNKQKVAFLLESSLLGGDKTISIIAFNDYLTIAGYENGELAVWDCDSHKLRYVLQVCRSVTSLISMIADNDCIIYGLSSGMIGMCDFSNPKAELKVSEDVARLNTTGTAYCPWHVLKLSPQVPAQ